MNLHDKACIVTGGGRGIGRATAIGLCAAGANVIVSARTAADLEETARLCRDRTGRCVPRVTDMGDRGQIQALEDRGSAQIVSARVPMSQMFGYASDLRERTLGRGTFTSKLDRYEPVSAGPDESDDRNSYVGWPVTPRRPLNSSAVALPEPD
jgi:NAD(P)-dependent dehydrogenase (short-subunit alcohol dehydrogenase family)